MKRVLFVDDEPAVLDGLRRQLRPMRDQWDMAFVQSGEEALTALAQGHYDVIVTDIRMPGMDGATLLKHVRELYPHMVRIVLSGHTDKEALLRSVGPTHQFLSKPCDADTLRYTVDRACSITRLLAREELIALVSKIGSLPSLPAVYAELVEALESEDVSIQRVGEIIGRDVAMTAKILQLVNSAFFGLPRHVSTPAEAAALLGTETIRAMVLSLHVFTALEPTGTLDVESLWKHSSSTSLLAKKLAQAERADKRVADDAFIAGFLHAAGTLVISSNLPEAYALSLQNASTRNLPISEVEREQIGASHGELGAYLLALWALPTDVVEAVAYHDKPSASATKGFTPLTAVHVACALDTARSSNLEPKQVLDMEYVTREGFEDRLESWIDTQRTLLEPQEKVA